MNPAMDAGPRPTTQAAALGYVALPKDVVSKEEEALDRIR
jgi:hypothetical protein